MNDKSGGQTRLPRRDCRRLYFARRLTQVSVRMMSVRKVSQDRCTTTKPIGPLLMDTTHMYHTALFGVMTSLPNNRKTGKRVVYVIY